MFALPLRAVSTRRCSSVRFMVLGATGMAGHMVSIYLLEQGHEVVGWSRKPASFLAHHVEGDAYDLDGLHSAIRAFRPDVVVNCVGLLRADCDAHHDRAVYLDAYFPHALAVIAEEEGARVFHLSTDCVFEGNGGPYTEDSMPDAREFYGRAKALGELRDDRNLTLRQSIVGPDIEPHGIGLLNWFMAQDGAVNGWTGAIWTGLTTLELAKAIEACAVDGSTGLVNMVPESAGISKNELLCLFSREMRNGAVEVVSDSSFSCDKTLVRTALPRGYRPASYEGQVAELASWMWAHRSFYPHYEGRLAGKGC